MTETLAPIGGAVLNFKLWSFVLVSDFEFQISDFSS